MFRHTARLLQTDRVWCACARVLWVGTNLLLAAKTQRNEIQESIRASFDDPTTSDLQIKVRMRKRTLKNSCYRWRTK
jgi:hypothetical protein